MKKITKNFLKNQQGAALLEFFIVFPFLFMLLFAGLEIARYILIIQKVDNAAYAVTDAVAQMNPPKVVPIPNEATAARVTDAMNLLNETMWPYDDTSRQAVVVSSVHREASGRRLRWQRSIPGSLGINSVVTNAPPTNTLHRGSGGCGAAPFSVEYSAAASGMLNGENMIVGEVYYRYIPLWQTLLSNVADATPTESDGFTLSPHLIRRVIVMHPRSDVPPGKLIDLGNPPSQPILVEEADC